ncbi:MAG: glycosyl transferase [Chryseobacterium sp. 36-9]|uniref:Glycosyl transferase family 2 n=1 Tax=Epilithonimonas pallida TaxID=373671 RepID=A0ABY1R0K1_9FLAO|nr:glycosyltransferase family 2 protein [Epilithonimonas pallida]OJX32102.1 MAG: glycosyl transferase [Chryseobacterium sp. 36-9]SMP91610.1 Glycosyl transferase family 2 [Epilithonimonas pallida]
MKLTIITINYNNKEGLVKTFDSVRVQTWKDFEFIVIDGGSTDGCKELIEQNHQINYWVSEKDSGVYNAMNKGIRKATGDYVIFMNSGDFFYDEFVLEKVKNQFDSGIGILYGDSVFFNEDKGYRKVIKSPNNLTFGFFYDGGLNHQAAFIKRSLFSDYFFYNENYKICADWEFFIILISIYNVSHKYLNEIICYYDFSGISAKSENLPVYNQEREKTLNKYFSAFKEDAKLTQEMRAKRMKQVLHIKKYPVAWRIFKWMISLFLLFLPKYQNDFRK